MDLGATVCTRTKPQCERCPVAADCIAFDRTRSTNFPAPRPRKALPQRHTQMLVLLHANEVLLEKRAPTGIWGGLWSFPEAAAGTDIIASVCPALRCRGGGACRDADGAAHGFTHFKLDIAPQRLIVRRIAPHAARRAMSGCQSTMRWVRRFPRRSNGS